MSKTFGRALAPAFAFLFAIASFWATGRTASAAQLTYTAQARTVRSYASSGLGIDTNSPQYHIQSAADTGPFDAAVSSQLVYDAFSTNQGAASQRSVLMPTYAQAYGSVSGVDAISFGGTGTGQGESHFVVSFTLDQSSGYDFDLNVVGTFGKNRGPTPVPDISFGYSASLVGPGGTVFDTGKLSVAAHPTFTGQLAGGDYTLSVHVENGSTGYATGSGAATYNAFFIVPEPASVGICGIAAALLGRRRRRAG